MLSAYSQLDMSEILPMLSGGWEKLGILLVTSDPYGRFDSMMLNEIDQSLLQNHASKLMSENSDEVRFLLSGNRPTILKTVRDKTECCGIIACVLPKELSSSDEGLFELFSSQLKNVLDRKNSNEEMTSVCNQLSQCYEELSFIYKLTPHESVNQNPKDFLRQFSADILDMLNSDYLVMKIDDKFREAIYVEAGNKRTIGNVHIALCRYLSELFSHNREPVILSDLSAHPALVKMFKRTRMNIISMPILSNDEITGVLVALNDRTEQDFDSADMKLLGCVTRQLGSFVQNQYLVTDIHDLLTGFLISLVSAIDAKDAYTRGHSQRVAFIAEKISLAMGIPKRETTKIYMAGLLHDLGKIGISEKLLCKPGRLTTDEFCMVQQHPVTGSKIISSVRQLKSILPGVLYHHERYDGSGYPEGLNGGQIPLMGLIVGLADTFDAITSERTYHSAKSFEEAISEIKKETGQKYSPIVVDGLLRCDLYRLKTELDQLAGINSEYHLSASPEWFK
jgi:HD-GYP domain-containing protein (c-di-GMP phosphodiesterase class II)